MAERIVDSARVWAWLVGARIRADWQYRISFLAQVAGTAVLLGLDFAAIAILFTNVPRLGAWRLEEVAFLYGMAGLAFALAELAVGQVEQASMRIRDGSFDRLLVRPLGPLVQLSADHFSLRRLGQVVQAGAVFVFAVGRVDVTWSPGRVLLCLFSVLAAAVLFGGVFVTTNALAFWVTDARETASVFTYGGNFLTQYPLPILDQWAGRFLAAVVPLAFVSYVPAVAILGKSDPVLPAELVWFQPFAAAATAAVAAVVWRAALRRYRSTGS